MLELIVHVGDETGVYEMQFFQVVKTEESSAGEGHPGDRLSHITATRPKQPNKRPPSTVFRTVRN